MMFVPRLVAGGSVPSFDEVDGVFPQATATRAIATTHAFDTTPVSHSGHDSVVRAMAFADSFRWADAGASTVSP